MIKVYHNGKLLFCMPKIGFRLSDLTLAASIIAKKRGLRAGWLKWRAAPVYRLDT